jgi:rod shape-determining protein MreC
MATRAGRSETLFLRLLLLAGLSVTIMVADHRTDYLQSLRSILAAAIVPVQWVAAVPSRVVDSINSWLESEEDVRARLDRLRNEHVQLKAQLQRLQAMESENASLRRLLAAAEQVPDKVLMAELVEVSLDPYTHKILVNRGFRDGIYVGQPVLDQEGVMGQVTEIMPFSSAVTLITDPSHGLPVQVRRNGLRAIALGTGQSDELKISYLTPNADIQVGDILVTSGLGGRFPRGYPVAEVKELISDASEAFLRIAADPVARLDRTNQVLLVWHGLAKQADPAQQPDPAAQTEPPEPAAAGQ